MTSPESQIQFLTILQRLLAEGAFVSTYKYALLMALADIAVEHGADDERELEISTRLIAEKFIDYYWPQSTPFAGTDGARGINVLRQNTGKQSGIISLLITLRSTHEGSLVKARAHSRSWSELIAAVEVIVRSMPLWKLQTVGGQRLEFLYANANRGGQITLKPGVSYCLRKHYSLVSDLVKGAWVRYVRRFNNDLLGQHADLGEFLFGSERASLAALVPVLQEFQEGDCFYCRRALRGESVHVDHFIPWSRYPIDLGHNFVLTHAKCNSDKSDRLAAVEHLVRWVARQERVGEALEREFSLRGISSDRASSLRITHWAYSTTFGSGGLTWVTGNELCELRPDWRASLSPLLH